MTNTTWQPIDLQPVIEAVQAMTPEDRADLIWGDR